MPVTQRRTQQQIRRGIGLAANLLDVSGGSVTLQVTGTSSADAWTVGALTFGSSNEHRGKWAYVTAGSGNASSNIGLTRRISGSTSSNTRITFATSWAATPDTTQAFELWDDWASPLVVHELMNQAISEATRKSSVAVRDLNIHTTKAQKTYPFSVGSSFIGIQEIEYRESWAGESITTFDAAASSGTNVTVDLDSEDKREGQASNRLTIPASVSSAATVATITFNSIDARGYTHVELWAKSNITTTSSNLRMRLGEGSTNRETINLPALNADSWTYLRLALSSAETDSAITRFIVLTGASDAGEMVFWVDDAKFVRDQSEEWVRVPRMFWGLDQNQRALVFEHDATVPAALLRITGRRAPNLLSTDSAICEVSPDYVTNSVLAKLLRTRADVGGQSPDAAAARAHNYEQLAQTHYLRMPTPQSIRWLENA